jgi:HSP20 family protein
MADFSKNPESHDGSFFVRIKSSGWQVSNKTYSWSPPTDVFENDENLIIKIEIAGMKQSEILVNFEDKSLAVSGTRRELSQRRAYRQMEIRFGDFYTGVNLIDGLDLENAVANYDDGFLTIKIPYAKATNIQIKGK